jgi:hypothetical protein
MSDRKPEPPADAVAGREAQDHELADVETGGAPQPGRYPADRIPQRDGDITPDAPDPHVDWDDRVQPMRPDELDPEDAADASPDIETERT